MKISLKRDHQRIKGFKNHLKAKYFKSLFSKVIIRLYFIDIRVDWFVYGLCTFRFHFLFVRFFVLVHKMCLVFVYIPFSPSMSNSNFNFQNDQGYNSRGNQNYEEFNQDSSYRFRNNDRDLEESSSPSSIYTKYLELQIRMLKQTATMQGPSINSDEFQLKPTRVYPIYPEFGHDTSGCGSARPEFIQRAREPAGPNVV